MRKWMLKAMIQKLISFLPFRERINFFFQKYVTKGVHLDDQHFRYKLDAARDHIRFYRTHGTVPPAEALVLELGTGWYPIVPTALFLAGFKATVSIDISNWMKLERQLIAITKILDYYDRGLIVDYIPEIQPGRLATLRELVENRDQLTVTKLNQAINLDYRIMDATKLDFADDTFDFICSNNTFEHIYVDVLREILREFKRTVKTTGVMSHFIDLSDHFAHMDGTINIYNFLRYGDKTWDVIDNRIQPQNRLRWKDYRAMYREVGIPIREEEIREGDVEQVKAIPVHEQYRAYTPEELAISHGYIIS